MRASKTRKRERKDRAAAIKKYKKQQRLKRKQDKINGGGNDL